MGIKSFAGGTIATGTGVEVFRLLSLRGRVTLEGKGLKGSINATAIAMRDFGIPGKATAKNRAIVLQRIEEKLAELKPKVAEENACV